MSMLRPFVLTASLTLWSLSAVAAPDGVKVYNQNCAMCHNAGLAKAPKFGDKEAWEPRLAGGQPALLQSVMQGKGAMPPKGGNPKLSEEEVAAALSHMVAAAK
jgi:cytochrome c5